MTAFLQESVARKDCLKGPGFACALVRQGIRQQPDRLYVAARPSLIRLKDGGRSVLLLFHRRRERFGLDINRQRRSARRKLVASRCGSARHLQIDESVSLLELVVSYQLMRNLFEAARIQTFDS